MPVSLLATNFSEQYKEREKKVRILKIHVGKKKYDPNDHLKDYNTKK